MKIDASAPVLNLKGEPYKSEEGIVTVGSVVSDALALDQTGGKMKLYVLAKKFFDGGEVELDAVDLSLVKKAVEECKQYNNIIIGQVLLTLEA